MLWIYVPMQYPCDIPWEGSIQIWHNYRSPRRMRASNLSMQNNFLMKQCLLAMNERRNSMKLVFTVNFHVSFKVQTSEFHPHRMRLLPFHVHLWFSIAYFHVKCEKYLISPPRQKYSPLLGHPLRHLSVLRMYSFCQSSDLPFVKMYSRPYMARTWHAWGPQWKWPVKCCLKSLLELFKWD